MNGLIKYPVILLALVWMPAMIFATHNRAGEITYRQTGPLTIEMTIITYTKASSVAADRDSLDVSWGDGSKQFVLGTTIKPDLKPMTLKSIST
ncbi:MAG: hypothetical protein IPP49_05205 [Saprospiraceae bacterium]|nr:hypothetical protein [Saprospiraceae bacterium]